jgi:hypothetical protein
MATPLLVCLLFLEMTDIVFAVDSVPAIFAVTREPLIVYTSNVFAILGLRSLFFLLAGAIASVPHAEVRAGDRADFRGAEDGVVQQAVMADISRSRSRWALFSA